MPRGAISARKTRSCQLSDDLSVEIAAGTVTGLLGGNGAGKTTTIAMLLGLVLRFGLGAESLAWVAIFAVAPISGIYYPISVLPGWLQPVALALPSSYVFEGMRAVLQEGIVRTDLMIIAAALNVVYLAVGAACFLAFFHAARVRGLLLQVGE